MIQSNNIKEYISLGNSSGFYGYGNWDNEIYVLGIEEAGCYSESLIEQKINRYFELNFGNDGLFDNRLFQYSLVDELDKNLTHYSDFFDGNVKKGGYVPKITTLLKVLENNQLETYSYIQNIFGSVNSNHSLIEILPLACPKVDSWLYPNWIDCEELPFMNTKRNYINEIIKRRTSFIKSKITANDNKKLIIFLANGQDKINYWNQISPISIENYNQINNINYFISENRKMYVILPFPGSISSNGIFNSKLEISNVAVEIKRLFDDL